MLELAAELVDSTAEGGQEWGRSLARLWWCVSSCGVLWWPRLESRGSGWCVLLLAASGGGLVAVVVTMFPHDFRILILGCQFVVASVCVASRPCGVRGPGWFCLWALDLVKVDTRDLSQGIDLPVWDSVSTHLMGRSTHSGISVT
ncbi:hypothetical protein Taro_041907 [Colocasia esculenta]|uniref:Uncharacterized protein n=1 Tax=Colocasia esculenta TaxID=4460 RepID=A0A843WCL5_COLES|nr:hypothetical protein [Colocasia esculenta]